MLRTPTATRVARQALARTQQVRGNATRALSNPMLNNIEKRWESMPLQDQADLWMALRDRMKGNWKELTLQEKKAGRLFPRVLVPLSWVPRIPFGIGSTRWDHGAIGDARCLGRQSCRG
jgi:hypothetical protein